MGFVYELPFAKDATGVVAGDRPRTGRSTASSARSRARRSRLAATTPRSTSRAGSRRFEQVAETASRVGDRAGRAVYYDPASFAQPGNQWGNTGRNFLRGPGQWNLDFAAVPGVPDRPLPDRVPRAGDQRAEPHAVGQPGDRLHGSELPADPQRSGSAARAARPALRVLSAPVVVAAGFSRPPLRT